MSVYTTEPYPRESDNDGSIWYRLRDACWPCTQKYVNAIRAAYMLDLDPDTVTVKALAALSLTDTPDVLPPTSQHSEWYRIFHDVLGQTLRNTGDEVWLTGVIE